MRPFLVIDVLMLMAIALSSKRRPAELVEIVAAADLLQGSIPFVDTLGEAIQRLSAFGLISEEGGCFTLTQPAQEIMAEQPKKASTEEVMATLGESLSSYAPKGECASVVLTRGQLVAAIKAHKSSKLSSGKNLLMPKPKADSHFKVDGRWRRSSARGRKS